MYLMGSFRQCMLCIIMIPPIFKMIISMKPSNKRKEAIWRFECDTGVIADPDCPVDGGWALWKPWSDCCGTCESAGHRRRTRECNNPPPSKDGLPCSGPEEQIEACYVTNCTVDDYRKLAQGDATRTESLRILELVPTLMERCLHMECQFEAIEAALAMDNTWQLDPESLWNALQCVKFNMGCPVIGEWSTWGSWSACGARCGAGLRWKLRRCDTPPPSDVHLICAGVPLQTEVCEGDQCALDDQSFKYRGTWSEWGIWTECSENCGFGIRRRRRTCNEKHVSNEPGTWGTHCRGQHEQLEICDNKVCLLNGRWSGWSAWGPCSQSCGAGKRFRSRSCSRPIPSGGGTKCSGPKTEITSCYLAPCEAYTHIVALFNGESSLEYNFPNKHSTLFHYYVRFIPLSPHGTLIRRGTIPNLLVRLSLQKWHVCLDASGISNSCNIPRICSPLTLEPEVWHSVLVTITNVAATLRLNNARMPVKRTFQCDPQLPDESIHIFVGENFHGEMQELILNFIPLNIFIQRDISKHLEFSPSSASNIAYEKANTREAYLVLDSDQYIRLPCFDNQDEWKVQITLKPKRESGTLLFLHVDKSETWLHMLLQNMRLKLKLALKDYHSESISNMEYAPDQWVNIALTKKSNTNTVEALLNSEERLHISLTEETARKRREYNKMLSYRCTNLFSNNTRIKKSRKRKKLQKLATYPDDVNYEPKAPVICEDEFYVGGVPIEVKQQISEEFTSFIGIISSININDILQDLYKCNIERYTNGKVQLSSRTASVSGSYHETAWGQSYRLNLTCLHTRTVRSPHSAHWLFLDTRINEVTKEKYIRSVDDGRVLRLVASTDNDPRGFYTCRAHTNKRTRNIVTYGVLGKIQYKLTRPDTTTALAVFTTLTLVIGTLAWLVIEGINDLRNGYGFFRDRHLSPEEEAEAVCNYIDQNLHLIGSKSLAKMAKDKARRKGRQLASRAHVAAQEPQGILQVEKSAPLIETTPSETEEVPALPEIKPPFTESSHDVYRVEPCYVSSPRHGSITTSPRVKFTSSSSCEISPRFLCSRLLMTKRISSPRESLVLRKGKSAKRIINFDRLHNSPNLLTIKSSAYITQSPAQMILQKFKQLKSSD